MWHHLGVGAGILLGGGSKLYDICKGGHKGSKTSGQQRREEKKIAVLKSRAAKSDYAGKQRSLFLKQHCKEICWAAESYTLAARFELSKRKIEVYTPTGITEADYVKITESLEFFIYFFYTDYGSPYFAYYLHNDDKKLRWLVTQADYTYDEEFRPLSLEKKVAYLRNMLVQDGYFEATGSYKKEKELEKRRKEERKRQYKNQQLISKRKREIETPIYAKARHVLEPELIKRGYKFDFDWFREDSLIDCEIVALGYGHNCSIFKVVRKRYVVAICYCIHNPGKKDIHLTIHTDNKRMNRYFQEFKKLSLEEKKTDLKQMFVADGYTI